MSKAQISHVIDSGKGKIGGLIVLALALLLTPILIITVAGVAVIGAAGVGGMQSAQMENNEEMGGNADGNCPTTVRYGKRSSAASVCPPMPRVQSIMTGPAALPREVSSAALSIAGASRSRQRWRRTGSCRPAASVACACGLVMRRPPFWYCLGSRTCGGHLTRTPPVVPAPGKRRRTRHRAETS